MASTTFSAPDAALIPLEKRSVIDLATPTAEVSAFCRAVISTVFPNQLWGLNGTGQENKRVILQNVDRFVHLRRFETIFLHEVIQNIKVISDPICIRASNLQQARLPVFLG